MKLQPKQKKFIKEYLKDFNATQAAIRAGYSKTTAYSIGQENLKKPVIKAQIDKHLYEVELTTQRIALELSKVAYADIEDYLTVDDGNTIELKPFRKLEPGKTRAIKKVREKSTITESKDGKELYKHSQVEFELHDKLKALELAGRHLKMFEGKQDKPTEASKSPDEMDGAASVEDIKNLLGE